MSPIISQFLHLNVGPAFNIHSPPFTRLRQIAREKGGAMEQYFGIPTGKTDSLCWVIQWPQNADPMHFDSSEFKSAVNALDVNGSPQSWYIPFSSADLPRPGLVAPLTELCCVHLKSSNVLESTAKSLHQTFADCYDAPEGGFSGGHWGTALNDDRMNWYYLGWETRQHHTKYAQSELFAVEINKLEPVMDDGYAVFVKLEEEK